MAPRSSTTSRTRRISATCSSSSSMVPTAPPPRGGDAAHPQLMLRFLTAGESHGPRLVIIVDGMPAGVRVRPAAIDADLRRRQGGYGRGGRQKIEKDTA